MAQLLANKRFVSVDVTLTYKGKSVVVPAAIDTGASDFGFLDAAVANGLGLPLGDKVGYSGVGGVPQEGWFRAVDSAFINENKKCQVNNFEILAGTLGAEQYGIKMLVGQDFMRTVGMNLKFEKSGNVVIACEGSEGVVIPPKGLPILSSLQSPLMLAGLGIMSAGAIGLLFALTHREN
jgi:hypothetical protein